MSDVLVDEQALAQLTAELYVTKQQLAEVRAALRELQERPWLLDAELDQWRERHATALKAAREVKP